MRHHRQQQADRDVALVLVSGVTGIPPRNIETWALLAGNSECGIHLTTNACCAYHALQWAVEAAVAEHQRLTPCSADGH